jgi:hypothetical protein
VRTPGLGTYSFDTSIAAQGKGYTGERTLSYFPGQDLPGATEFSVRQTTRIFPEKTPKEFWFRYRWQADGVYELAEINPSAGRCTFDHPMLQTQFPLSVGASWSSNARCKEDGTVHALTARVDRTETRTVGKTKVRTFVISRQTTTGSSQPLFETWWFSPVWLINVRMDTTTHAAGASFDLIDDLRSLKPGTLPGGQHPSGY